MLAFPSVIPHSGRMGVIDARGRAGETVLVGGGAVDHYAMQFAGQMGAARVKSLG